ncbi:MAG: BamA/TamA family outer membrane protein [Oscillatoria sp. SIO1A7]|nr:BamA/TamA family outer membrane protein [Oscillatoria sp. SIO1A7]
MNTTKYSWQNPIPPLALMVGTVSATLLLASPTWGQTPSIPKTASDNQYVSSELENLIVPQAVWDRTLPIQSWRPIQFSGPIQNLGVENIELDKQHNYFIGNTNGMLAQYREFDEEFDDGPKFSVNPVIGSSSLKGLYGGLNFRVLNLGNNNHILDFGFEGGTRTLGGYASLTDPWGDGDPLDSGYTARFFISRSPEANFFNGDPEVELIHDHAAWVHRIGGSFEFFKPVNENGLVIGVGGGYQQVSIRNAAITDSIFTRDQFGNRVTVSDDGKDDLLTLNLSAFQDRRNDPFWPTTGYRFGVGTEQSIPVGDSNLSFNRLRATYSKFMPIANTQTVVFNIQGGTIIGDAAPYEAFSIGGTNSVRGYSDGEVGTGRSFVQASLEYRFPIVSDLELPLLSRLGGTVFADYGTDLRSGDTVRGEPGEVRNKSGSGAGFGVGLRALSDFGPLRLEFALSDQGDAQIHFALGERF